MNIDNVIYIILLGINFRDISTMLADPQAFKDCMEGIYHALEDVEYDVIAGK